MNVKDLMHRRDDEARNVSPSEQELIIIMIIIILILIIVIGRRVRSALSGNDPVTSCRIQVENVFQSS